MPSVCTVAAILYPGWRDAGLRGTARRHPVFPPMRSLDKTLSFLNPENDLDAVPDVTVALISFFNVDAVFGLII